MIKYGSEIFHMNQLQGQERPARLGDVVGATGHGQQRHGEWSGSALTKGSPKRWRDVSTKKKWVDLVDFTFFGSWEDFRRLIIYIYIYKWLYFDVFTEKANFLVWC